MKKALLVYGGWDGHEPKQCVDVVAPMLEGENFSVEISDSLEFFEDREKMMSLDLIVPVWTHGTLNEKQEVNLLDAVASGVGIAGWHGQMGDAFRSNTGYHFMIGGQFVGHPGGMIEYEVNVIKNNDPIMSGISDFKMCSEQFYLLVDPMNEVLATTVFNSEECPWINGCVMPVVWKKKWGQGDVFYSSLGHTAEELKIPEVMEILKRGMLWASK